MSPATSARPALRSRGRGRRGPHCRRGCASQAPSDDHATACGVWQQALLTQKKIAQNPEALARSATSTSRRESSCPNLRQSAALVSAANERGTIESITPLSCAGGAGPSWIGARRARRDSASADRSSSTRPHLQKRRTSGVRSNQSLHSRARGGAGPSGIGVQRARRDSASARSLVVDETTSPEAANERGTSNQSSHSRAPVAPVRAGSVHGEREETRQVHDRSSSTRPRLQKRRTSGYDRINPRTLVRRWRRRIEVSGGMTPLPSRASRACAPASAGGGGAPEMGFKLIGMPMICIPLGAVRRLALQPRALRSRLGGCLERGSTWWPFTVRLARSGRGKCDRSCVT